MAKVLLEDFLVNNTTTQITAVTWQVALDDTFGVIIDESIFDTVNILSWSPGLTHYSLDRVIPDDQPLSVRIKVYTNDTGKTHESDWFIAKYIDPTNGEKDITHNGKVVARIKDNKDGTYTTLY